jgi:hypothetical protein
LQPVARRYRATRPRFCLPFGRQGQSCLPYEPPWSEPVCYASVFTRPFGTIIAMHTRRSSLQLFRAACLDHTDRSDLVNERGLSCALMIGGASTHSWRLWNDHNFCDLSAALLVTCRATRTRRTPRSMDAFRCMECREFEQPVPQRSAISKEQDRSPQPAIASHLTAPSTESPRQAGRLDPLLNSSG